MQGKSKTSQLNEQKLYKGNSINILEENPNYQQIISKKNDLENSRYPNYEIKWIRKNNNYPPIAFDESKNNFYFLNETPFMNSNYNANNPISAEELKCKMRIYKKIRRNKIQFNSNQLRTSNLNKNSDLVRNYQKIISLHNDLKSNIQKNQKYNDFQCNLKSEDLLKRTNPLELEVFLV